MHRNVFIVVALLCLVGTGVSGQDPPKENLDKKEVPIKSSIGRMGLGLPKPTSNGEWTGTWIYVSRDIRLALWMREDDGKPLAKLRYEGMMRAAETFETDWNGWARYFVQDHPGVFEFTIKETGADHIEADWDWVLDMRGSSRLEKSAIEMYRAGDGRRLVMHFKNFERIIESASGRKIHAAPQAWTFRKLSRRQARWEELPF